MQRVHPAIENCITNIKECTKTLWKSGILINECKNEFQSKSLDSQFLVKRLEMIKRKKWGKKSKWMKKTKQASTKKMEKKKNEKYN